MAGDRFEDTFDAVHERLRRGGGLLIGHQRRSMVPPELGGGIFLQLPLGHTAIRTDAREPFVSQPARGPAVAGIVDQEGLVAVGGDPGLVAENLDNLDAVQQAFARRPDLDLLDEPE